MNNIETLCKTCMGCNKQELDNFKEVYRCNNYAKGKDIKNTR